MEFRKETCHGNRFEYLFKEPRDISENRTAIELGYSGILLTISLIVYYAPRGRKGTLLTSTENTRVDEVPLPCGAYAIFYNTCVISDVFWSFQIF